MRRDDKERLEEQKKHLLEEFRSIGRRSSLGPVSADDRDRFGYLETELEKVNEKLRQEHETELNEIRRAKSEGFVNVAGGQEERLTPMFSQFARAGWKPGEAGSTGEIEFNYRTLTWSGSVDNADIASE